jgi:hypothetical protein
MGKKSKAERRQAAGKLEQRKGVQVTRVDKAIRTEVQLAAAFLVSGNCCSKAAKQETGMQKGVLAQIANGAAQAKPYQMEIIKTAATTLGWKPAEANA